MDLTNVSELSGVYLWKDNNNNVIYVGKAKNLKKRMSDYFTGSINSFKTTKMIEKIYQYETIICNNENEALILERNLIQKYKPFYNVCLLDDRKYPYINISLNKNELSIALKYTVKQESKYNLFYGPYLNNGNSKIILNFLKSECFYNKGLPIKKETFKFWEQKFLFAKQILSKNNNDFLNELTKKMYYFSDNEQFERANEMKNVIGFLSMNKDVQIVELKNNTNFDVISGNYHNDFMVFCIQFYRSGSLINSDIYTIEINISIDDTIRQFINQFYQNKKLPKKIITNLNIMSNDVFFESEVVIPQKGKYLSVLNLAIKNAKENIDFKILEYKNRQAMIINGLNFLKKISKQEDLNHIIMIDNSNTRNTNPISVVISYRNGIPQKSEYRKFNITLSNRRGDVEYMHQGLTQYFNKENVIPNILIVDGGIQQLNEAKLTLKKLNINIPIVGLVKNSNHKTSFIISNNSQEVNIDKDAFLFLSGMQEEVDRFAKTVHRNKNSKSSLEGILTKIPGIGPKTELKILKHFKTYNNIYNSNLEELQKVVSLDVAKKILNIFKH